MKDSQNKYMLSLPEYIFEKMSEQEIIFKMIFNKQANLAVDENN